MNSQRERTVIASKLAFIAEARLAVAGEVAQFRQNFEYRRFEELFYREYQAEEPDRPASARETRDDRSIPFPWNYSTLGFRIGLHAIVQTILFVIVILVLGTAGKLSIVSMALTGGGPFVVIMLAVALTERGRSSYRELEIEDTQREARQVLSELARHENLLREQFARTERHQNER